MEYSTSKMSQNKTKIMQTLELEVHCRMKSQDRTCRIERNLISVSFDGDGLPKCPEELFSMKKAISEDVLRLENNSYDQARFLAHDISYICTVVHGCPSVIVRVKSVEGVEVILEKTANTDFPLYKVLLSICSDSEHDSNISKALDLLRRGGCTMLRSSDHYLSESLEKRSRDSTHLAVLVETRLLPYFLRRELLAIESRLGRAHNSQDLSAPLPLHLEISFYRQHDPFVLAEDIVRYAHVAIPMAEICPDWVYYPNKKTLLQIAEDLKNQSKRILRQKPRSLSEQKAEAPKSAVERLAASYKEILIGCGEDVNREGLLKTPMRAAKAMQFLVSGYQQDLKTVLNGAVFTEDTKEVVAVHGITFHSLCEHHLLPFMGLIHIAYIPKGKVLGLSKLARVSQMFSRRLQVQERLTNQIANAINESIEASGVAVVIEAGHMCMEMRGVRQHGSRTTTSCFLGVFKTDERLAREFYENIRFSRNTRSSL